MIDERRSTRQYVERVGQAQRSLSVFISLPRLLADDIPVVLYIVRQLMFLH